MGTPIHGKEATIYLQGSGTEAILVSEQSEFSIEFDYDTSETTALGDSWREYMRGVMSWSGSFSGNFDVADTVLWNAAMANSVRKFYLYPDRATATRYYYGTCWVKLGTIIGGSVNDKAKTSVNITGDGPITSRP